MNLNELISGINPKCKFIPSFRTENVSVPRFYFFLHIPKCGGVDFESPYRYALQFKCSNNKERYLGWRADSEGPFLEFLSTVYRNRVFQENSNTCNGILSTHLGLKRLLREKLCLDHMFTIIRDPVDRVISAFGYHCMGRQTKPDVDLLKSFVRSPDNQNKITELLDSGTSSVDEMENRVRRTFLACVDVTESSRLLAYLLSRNNLPNVVSQNMNQTLPEHKINRTDVTDTLIREIQALNRRDIDFYERFRSNPLMPKDPAAGEIDAISLLMADKRASGKNLVTIAKFVKTKNFIDFLVANQAYLPDTLDGVMDMLDQKT